MRSTPYRNSRKAGFTLLELLICFVIISVVIGILAPSLFGAKEQANATKCTAYIRQISLALTSYAANNDDVLPKVNQDATTWMNAISGEVKKSIDIFKCPNERLPERKNITDFTNHLCTSYGLSITIAGAEQVNAGPFTQNQVEGVLLSNIEQPSQTIILAELVNNNHSCYFDPSVITNDQEIQISFKRHGGNKQSIYLFADGHTKAHTYAQIFPGDHSYANSWFNPARQ